MSPSVSGDEIAGEAPAVREPTRASPSGTRQPAARWPLRTILLLAVVAVLVYLAAMGVALVLARGDLRAGLKEVHLAEARAGTIALRAHPRQAITGIEAHATRAQEKFGRAHALLFPFGPVLRHLGWVPRYGNELAASPAAAALADELTEGAVSLASGLNPLVSKVGGRRSGHLSLPAMVRQVAMERNTFQRACTSFSQAEQSRRALAGFRASTITTPLRTVDRQLPRLQVVCRLLVLAPGLLGYRSPYTYLVAYQDPNEIRATGGFLGSFGYLTFHDGKATQQFHGTGIRDNLSIAPPEPLRLYDREPGWLFRDSNWSPDFPTSAALERFFLRLDLHRDAAAVVDVTPQATAAILQATGPIYAPEYHRWITSANVARLADYYTHQTAASGPLRFQSPDTQRKQFIQIVAQHLFARLKTLTPNRLFRLAGVMPGAIARGDIQMNFRDPRKQALVEEAGVSGRVNRESADYLYVVDSNIGYNKINPYVHLSIGYQAQIQTNRWLHASLTLHYQNVRAPSSVYRGSEGPGAGTQGGPADYGDFVRIYVPAGSEIISQSGWYQPWASGPAYGKTMFSGYLIVPVARTRVVHIHYIVPPNVFSWSHGARYHVLVQHQPGSHPAALDVAVTDAGRHIVSTAVAAPTTDWTVTVPVRRRPFVPVPLPHEPAVVVKPGHWIEPHAYLGFPR